MLVLALLNLLEWGTIVTKVGLMYLKEAVYT